MSQHGNLLTIAPDSPAIERLESALRSQGFRVRPAGGVRMAIESARIQVPDAVLIDIGGRCWDGFRACRRIRGLPELAQTPLICLGPAGDIAAHQSAIAAGADDYVYYATDPEEVALRLRHHLRLFREYRDACRTLSRLEDRLHHRTLALRQVRERIRHEQRRRGQAEAVYASAFERLPLMLALIDPADWTIREANPRFARAVGLAPVALPGVRLKGLGLFSPAFLSELTECARNPGKLRRKGVELRIPKGKGRRYDILLRTIKLGRGRRRVMLTLDDNRAGGRTKD